METIEPSQRFRGKIVLIVPHMDDEALACGGLIARLPNKELIHLVYATDGMRSPAPIVPRRDAITTDLGEVRVRESVAAMKLLGVPEANLHFLRLPEAQLERHKPALAVLLPKLLAEIRPDDVFVPFRYDRHRDHLAVNHAVNEGYQQGWWQGRLVEYFVYYRWRLLPGRDIRKYIRPDQLLMVDIQEVAAQKRSALNCFRSQTTLYYPWQTRPILTPVLLDEECRNPEIFLLHNPALPGPAVFSRNTLWIRLAHWLEPKLLKGKYLSGAVLTRLLRANVQPTH